MRVVLQPKIRSFKKFCRIPRSNGRFPCIGSNLRVFFFSGGIRKRGVGVIEFAAMHGYATRNKFKERHVRMSHPRVSLRQDGMSSRQLRSAFCVHARHGPSGPGTECDKRKKKDFESTTRHSGERKNLCPGFRPARRTHSIFWRTLKALPQRWANVHNRFSQSAGRTTVRECAADLSEFFFGECAWIDLLMC